MQKYVQYLGNRRAFIPAHGNSRDRSFTYIRTKPSVKDKMKELSQNKALKQVINILDRDSGGPCNAKSLSDMPANRQQVYNVNRGIDGHVSRNNGKIQRPDFSKLVASLDSNDRFLKDVNFSSRRKVQKLICTQIRLPHQIMHCSGSNLRCTQHI